MDNRTLYMDLKRGYKGVVGDTYNNLHQTVANQLWGYVRKYCKEEVDREVKKALEGVNKCKGKRQLLTEDERADAVAGLLDEKLLSGEITAAELGQFKDIFGLKQRDQDIRIESVSYGEVFPEGFKRIKECVSMLIDQDIEEANREE